MLPSALNIQAAQDAYELLHSWRDCDAALQRLFYIYPSNSRLVEVIVKVATLDRLYGTNLLNPVDTARRIVGMENLDQCLRAGDPEVVELIARSPARRELVFASKYAHFHDQTSYPIYDKYAGAAVWHFYRLAIDSSLRARREFRPESYVIFLRVYQEVVDAAGLAGQYRWDKLDRYMWLYGLKLALGWCDKTINRAFMELINAPEGRALMERLEPDTECGQQG